MQNFSFEEQSPPLPTARTCLVDTERVLIQLSKCFHPHNTVHSTPIEVIIYVHENGRDLTFTSSVSTF